MSIKYIVSSLIASLLLRLGMRRGTKLALTEAVLVFGCTKVPELSPTTYLVLVLIFLLFAFCQTQNEYLQSLQDAYMRDPRPQSKKLPRNSGLNLPIVRQRNHSHDFLRKNAPVPQKNGNHQLDKTRHGRVMMFACNLRHLRRSGFKDDYHHSYLYVGYPVGLSACYSPLITVEPRMRPGSFRPFKRSWFSIRPEDHAFNGGPGLSMRQKLDEFLESQGENPVEWPYAYLLTPPSITWQLNNPLSFWYLYDNRKVLSAMIVQLQTSYGERRLWLTRNCQESGAKSGPYAFKGKFVKDLQISPFTPNEASYVIESSDPCCTPLHGLKIMVTLKDGEKTVMHGVVSTTSPPLDAKTASLGVSVAFLARWWWVPMCAVVVFRILSKAAKIYLTHSLRELNIQKRPEPTTTAVSKSARISERTLEKYFSIILSAMVKRQTHIRSVKYITPGEHCDRVRVFLSHQKHGHKQTPCSSDIDKKRKLKVHEQIVFQVNTPTFYTRFFHYRSPFAAIQSELLDDVRTRTVWSSHPLEFAALFLDESPDTLRAPADWRWQIISTLRTSPVKTSFPRRIHYEPFKGNSVSDDLITAYCSGDQIRDYQRALVRLFLGHWIGGFSIGPLKGDFELIGLSRDAVLMSMKLF